MNLEQHPFFNQTKKRQYKKQSKNLTNSDKFI